MNKRKFLQTLLLTSSMLASCSGPGSASAGGQGGNPGGEVGSLQIIAPKTVFNSPTASGNSYIVINNPTKVAVKDVHYTLSNLIGSATGVTIDKTSAAGCAVVESNSWCKVKLVVPTGITAGSFSFVATGSNLSGKTNEFSKTSAQFIQTVGVEQPASNNLSGADGIILNYYHTVISGTSYIMVSALVVSPNAGIFNQIVLVDNNGNEIPNQIRIGEAKNVQGSVFSILLPVSAGNNVTQTIKAQTRQITNGKTVVVSTAKMSSTLTTTKNRGIVELLPGNLYLTESTSKQTVTLLNIGDTVVNMRQLVSNNPNVEVTSKAETLATGSSTTATLKLKYTRIPAMTGNITLTYDSGQGGATASAIVNQNTVPDRPVPHKPFADLSVTLAPDSNFYTTTAGGPVSRRLTLKNTGNTEENNITLALLSGFSIANTSDTDSCMVDSGSAPVATISDSLEEGKSCDVMLSYGSTIAVNENTGNLSISYSFNGNTPAPEPVVVPVSYRVTQSTANLSLSPNTIQTYTSIVGGSVETSLPISYTLTNSGDETASEIIFKIEGLDADLFKNMGTGSCTAELSVTSGHNSCTIDTEFGPSPPGSEGAKKATFSVSYMPYPNSLDRQEVGPVDMRGQVTSTPSAVFTVAATSNDFSVGNGTMVNPYGGNTNTNYTINVTYTNTSIDATGFTTDISSVPANFVVVTHGCNNVSMPKDGTCTDIYQLNSSVEGNYNLNLTAINTSWTDTSSYADIPVAGSGIVYTNIFDVPQISMTTSITGCPRGNGSLANACYDNTQVTGGNAANLRLKLAFMNNGILGATNKITLATTATNLLANDGFSSVSNSCEQQLLPGNSCEMIFSITSPNTPSLKYQDGTIDYNVIYGNSRQSQTDSSSLQYDIQIVNPTISIDDFKLQIKSSPKTIGVTFNNLYNANLSSSTIAASVAVADKNCDSYDSVHNNQICNITLAGPSIVGQNQTLTVNAWNNTVNDTQTYEIARMIFVTAATYNGDLGGSNGANQKCNTNGNGKPDGTTAKAILNKSSNTVGGARYFNASGDLIGAAVNGNEFRNNGLQNPIGSGLENVWFGTGGSSNNDCADWRSSTGTPGRVGNASSTDSKWRDSGTNAPCNTFKSLYCATE